MGQKIAYRDCIGLMNCQNPETCTSYSKCLNDYVGAEIRNENLTLREA